MKKLNISARKAYKEEDFKLAEYYLDRIKEENDSIKEMQKEFNRLQQTLEEESVKNQKLPLLHMKKMKWINF